MARRVYQCKQCNEPVPPDIAKCPHCSIEHPLELEHEWWFICLWLLALFALGWTVFENFS